MSLTDAVKRMRGKPGETVSLTILRESEKKLLEFKLIRATIKIKGVKEAALFGATIHTVVYDSLKAIPKIKEFLNKENVKTFTVDKISPSLEDVFVSSIETYDKEHSVYEPKKD